MKNRDQYSLRALAASVVAISLIFAALSASAGTDTDSGQTAATATVEDPLASILIAETSWLERKPLVGCVPMNCPSEPVYRTPTFEGFGSDCAAARDDAEGQAGAYAVTNCHGRLCNYQFFETTACFWNPSQGMYQVDGHVTWTCQWC